MSRSRTGVAAAVGAFLLWGVLPAFWKLLEFLPAATIVAQRTLWSLLLLLPLVLFRHRLWPIFEDLRSPRRIASLTLSGALLAANWIVYVWATLNDRILEGALGYYLNPFFNLLLGAIFLGERYGRAQLIAIGIAAAGVALQFPAVEGIPWVAFFLGSSFSLYGYVKKKAPLEALDGLVAETALLAPVALGWLIFTQPDLPSAFGGSWSSALLVAGTGLATATPLLLFGMAARRIRLSTLGILQFLGPTLQFLLGWLVYGEKMTPLRGASFGLIWVAVIVYAVSAQKESRRERPASSS